MLENVECDYVDICVWNRSHSSCAIAAARAGKDRIKKHGAKLAADSAVTEIVTKLVVNQRCRETRRVRHRFVLLNRRATAKRMNDTAAPLKRKLGSVGLLIDVDTPL